MAIGPRITTERKPGTIDFCDYCAAQHEATYSHEGRFGEGPLYAVVCTVDGLTDYYQAWRVTV